VKKWSVFILEIEIRNYVLIPLEKIVGMGEEEH